MAALRRGLLIGAGFGLAIACFESWFAIYRLSGLNLPPITWPLLLASVIGVALTTVLGGLLSPLLRLPLGWLWLMLGMGLLWFGLNNAVSPESEFLFMSIVISPVVGLGLLLAGYLVSRWRPWLPAALGVIALLVAFGYNEARVLGQGGGLPDVASRPPAPEGAPDVVLVVLDTVRAQKVSAYGYERQTTPTIDALAREGLLFLDATSPSTWSLPSHASLFTGLFVSGHGAHHENHYLRDELPTLGETLRDAGWETGCFTPNPWISDPLGTARGFDWSDEAWRSGDMTRSMVGTFRLLDYLGFRPEDKGGDAVASNFERWLAERPADARPAFVFLNFIEAHFPYHQLPDEYQTRYSSLDAGERRELSMQLFADQFGESDLDKLAAVEPAVDMYDAGILYADMLLGRLVGALRERGTLDSTILIVLSDHGELVGEHLGYGHGISLYEPATRVPLVVRYPPAISAGSVVDVPVSTVGVMATILDLVDVEPQEPLHVGSLLPALEGRPAGQPVIAERFASEQFNQPNQPTLMRGDVRHRSYRVGTLKLIETSNGESFLFDLATDPAEENDLAASRPDALARMRDELDTWRAALALPAVDAPIEASADIPELDEAARERLKALGYVE